ncbi:O-acetylhomoserine aminocarboxypropyltransferase/cysteine synthase family protein [Lentisphaerota bacterium WC36G]|nr:O-acetylhomoserine aminocarboxypropyltransferase/cysteine synthase [Lentisphaerae bacterium WC36]
MNENNYKISTNLVQGSYRPKNGEARVFPVYQNTTYRYDSVEELATRFNLEQIGDLYSRISNPTVSELENKVAMLDGGVGALATSSGTAAITLAILNIVSSGDHIISVEDLYGGTISLFKNRFKSMNIEVTFVPQDLSIDELQKFIKPNTKLVYGETLGNPSLNILDIKKFATLAHNNNVPLMVDNTFLTPYLCQPLKHGADIVVYSASKYFDGHACALGGVIVDGGSFDWTNGKYNEFTTPDESYHGLIYSEAFGNMAYIVRARTAMLRDTGAALSPQNAFLINLGLETLHLRMEKHSQNALALAEYLQNHPKVAWVNYPLLKAESELSEGQKYLTKGASGIVTVGIKGGFEASKQLMNNLKLTAIVTHVADVRSSVLHPASTSHRQLSAEELAKAKISEDLIRISVGIEDIIDIITDFEQAFAIS